MPMSGKMPGKKILVISPREALLGSLVFSLEAEGYRVESSPSLPSVAWMREQRFDACVVDQHAIDKSQIDAISFCLLAHPVILIAEKAAPFLYEWVSEVVIMPDTGEGLTTALRDALAPAIGGDPLFS